MDQSREKKVTLNLEEVSSVPGIQGPITIYPGPSGTSDWSPVRGPLSAYRSSIIDRSFMDGPQSPDFELRIKQKKIQIQNANNVEELDSFLIHQMRKMQF